MFMRGVCVSVLLTAAADSLLDLEVLTSPLFF